MQSVAALASAIAIGRLSPDLREWCERCGGLVGLAALLDKVQLLYSSESQQMVGFVMYIQTLLESDPEFWNMWLSTAWTMAAKTVFDDGIYIADTLTVWNHPEISCILGKRRLSDALICEEHIICNNRNLASGEIQASLHRFRSAMLRVVLQEDVLLMLRAPTSARHPMLVAGPLCLRVLIIDADKPDMESMYKMFKQSVLSTTVHTTSNAEEALLNARSIGYDVILIDLQMLCPHETLGPAALQNNMPVGLHQTALAHAVRRKVNLLLNDSMFGRSDAYGMASGDPLILAYARDSVAEADIESLCTTSRTRDKRAYDAVFSAPFTLHCAHAALGMCWGAA
jgi:CheY-like chemotaxis protein